METHQRKNVEPDHLLHGELLSKGGPQNNRPSAEHLEKVFLTLSETLPRFFTHTMDYSIYHPELIFENNIRGTRTM